MDPDLAVGQRLAALRKQKELRQEDFLALLAARGVGWTQTVLSRVEGGKRALKATEAFAVADALGVDPGQLNPAAGDLFYQIQSHRLKYREATAAARRAVGSARTLRARLIALTLANEIQSGRTEFTVYGTPHQFVELVSEALSPEEYVYRLSDGETAAGIDGVEVEREYESLAAAEFPDSEPKDDDDFRLRNAAYQRVFARHIPMLKFAGDEQGVLDGDFTVEEINVDDESYGLSYMEPSTLADMLYGRATDGG